MLTRLLRVVLHMWLAHPQLHHLAAAGPRRKSTGPSWPKSRSAAVAASPTSPGTEQLPLFRLHYGGSAHSFGFAIYSAARGRCENAVLLTGLPVGTPQEAACSTCAPLFGITLVPNANSSRSQFRPRMYQVPSSPILWAAMGSLECPGTNSSDLIPRSNEMLGGYHCLP